MNKSDEIFNLFNQKLFAEKLEIKDFLKRTPRSKSETIVFACEHKEHCRVNQNKHPIWTPALGCEDTKVMITGEAPSKTEGLGIHFGGWFKDWENDPQSPVVPLRYWVEENYGTVPYFTDLAKCGLARQQDKAELKVRIPKCVEYLLTKEIEIIKTRTILCVGNTAYDFVRKLKLKEEPDVFKLLHWSNRGSLPLTIEDKKQIIWKWQVSSGSDKEKLVQLSLSNLSFFRDKTNSA